MEIAVQYNAELDMCCLTLSSQTESPYSTPQVVEAFPPVLYAHDCTRILSDARRLEITGTLVDVYRVIPDMVDLGFSRINKIALVAARDIDAWQFMENVTVNRGINGRIFSRLTLAIYWLIPGTMSQAETKTERDGARSAALLKP